MRAVLTKSLTLRGFINIEFAADHYAEFLRSSFPPASPTAASAIART